MAEAREIIARSQHDHGQTFPSPEFVADHILSKLTAAGFRIIPPGELDAETLERAAAKLESLDLPPKHDGAIVEAVEALRSLSPKGGTP
jgi:hypothetical protein